MEKVLLVTGASSDIGAALIHEVSDDYDKIICHYRSSNAIIEELKKLGEKIIPIYADFSELSSTENFIEEIISRFSKELSRKVESIDEIYKRENQKVWRKILILH